MNFFQGLSRPLRLAGVALLGIAVIAAIIGIVTAVSGGNGGTSAAPTSSAPPGPGPGQGSSSGAPSTSSSAPAGTTTPSPATPPPGGPGAPPATSGQAGAPPATGAPGAPNDNGGVPADQAAAKWVPVRVYNNSTISGLAKRAADDLRADGWNVVEESNYPYGVIPTTTAFYTPGTDEETAAKAIASWFGMKAEPRFEGIQNASPGVIVIVTKDYQGLRAKGS
ncbi:LytR C-terminal domain-containing protein [Amycolatopsis acidiphila]|uniref:LytR family transcriptional regulator n=1 Tax=Amycolatopsis acidiphila TaxID=715473 RepID=A0A558A2T0_9PSEU|nr:LytR C-terminal domain-containing protein [Amycolatopsis acidiphila]TVT18563.1 LytR family transcriptional regulator [Amycolatopsis acidiphila]UIJ59356.1 LytR C-terminal domain-containing protein [Amycolatopsis acidiphila]GHG79875.1 hypothetical protein GCM10017788_48540 [Amycolatopsis acidiphila]